MTTHETPPPEHTPPHEHAPATPRPPGPSAPPAAPAHVSLFSRLLAAQEARRELADARALDERRDRMALAMKAAGVEPVEGDA